MEASKLIGAVLGTILRVVVTVFVVYMIYQGAVTCYDYGYRIFAEPAVSAGEGRQVTVAYTEEMSATEVGEAFAASGLTRDARLFTLQYLFSEYREDLKPGIYELSTAMTAEEMFEVMATASSATNESQE